MHLDAYYKTQTKINSDQMRFKVNLTERTII